MDLFGNIVIILGISIILFGALSIYLLPNFYLRLLVCSQIDTVGILLLLTGLLIRYYDEIYKSKVFLLIILSLLINPTSSYAIGKSAYLRGEEPTEDGAK